MCNSCAVDTPERGVNLQENQNKNYFTYKHTFRYLSRNVNVNEFKFYGLNFVNSLSVVIDIPEHLNIYLCHIKGTKTLLDRNCFQKVLRLCT